MFKLIRPSSWGRAAGSPQEAALMQAHKCSKTARTFRTLTLLLFFLALSAPGLTEPIVRVRYQAWNSGVDVDLVKQTLVRGEVHYEYSSQVSGTPSGSSSVKHPELKLTDDQVQALREFVEECGFLKLDEAYGAPSDQRYYPYEITVYFEGGEKRSVVYRSNPGYDEAPKAFRKLQQYLNELSGS